MWKWLLFCMNLRIHKAYIVRRSASEYLGGQGKYFVAFGSTSNIWWRFFFFKANSRHLWDFPVLFFSCKHSTAKSTVYAHLSTALQRSVVCQCHRKIYTCVPVHFETIPLIVRFHHPVHHHFHYCHQLLHFFDLSSSVSSNRSKPLSPQIIINFRRQSHCCYFCPPPSSQLYIILYSYFQKCRKFQFWTLSHTVAGTRQGLS